MQREADSTSVFYPLLCSAMVLYHQATRSCFYLKAGWDSCLCCSCQHPNNLTHAGTIHAVQHCVAPWCFAGLAGEELHTQYNRATCKGSLRGRDGINLDSEGTIFINHSLEEVSWKALQHALISTDISKESVSFLQWLVVNDFNLM